MKSVESFNGEFYHGAAVAFFHNNIQLLSIPRLFYEFVYCFEDSEIDIVKDEFKFQVILSSNPSENVSETLKKLNNSI